MPRLTWFRTDKAWTWAGIGRMLHEVVYHGGCRCHHTDADLEGLNVLFLNEDDDEMSVMPKAAWEMFSCFTKV